MEKFTIYCTKAQTKKALELGAPITTVKSKRTKDTILSNDVIKYDENTFTYVVSPTAEQTIGWLEEQGIILDIMAHNLGDAGYVYDWMRNDEYSDDIPYKTRKEATLAAIDAALEYLINKK